MWPVRNFWIWILTACCFKFCDGSYLGYPRINFVGQFRADSNTRNNDICNYRMDYPLNNNTNADWGFNGTNEFQFFDVKISSVFYKNGFMSLTDPVVGQSIIGNLERPFAKLVDLDADCQNKSTIYGLNFGIGWGGFDQDFKAFYGKWTRAVIAENMWPKMHCYKNSHYGSELFQGAFPLGSQGTTFITDVEWGDLNNSMALTQLKNALGATGKLSVRVSCEYYTRNYPPYVAFNATLGYVIGTIGIASPDDTLNFGGDRLLKYTLNTPVGLTFAEEDLCYDQDLSDYIPWMYNAPFDVDDAAMEVQVDLSNSFPVDLHGSLRIIKHLQLGILQGSCVHLLGTDPIPYLDMNWMNTTAGIYTYSLATSEYDLLSNSKLVLVQVLTTSEGSIGICGMLPSASETHSLQILLSETQYYIRPHGYFVDRLEYDGSSEKTLYVTSYGKPADVNIKLIQSPYTPPVSAVTPDAVMKGSGSNGLVTFKFTVTEPIPYPRSYQTPVCHPPTSTLPIDGQVYFFRFCTESEPASKCTDFNEVHSTEISFLVFSTVTYSPPYYWIPDVQAILAPYGRLNAIMKTILDLEDFNSVTLPRNIHLLNLSMTRDFEDPNLMPTSRDLSPTKRDVVLEWLKNPAYSKDNHKPQGANLSKSICVHIPQKVPKPPIGAYFKPPRCLLEHISFDENPSDVDKFFTEIFNVRLESDLYARETDLKKPPRPLFNFSIDAHRIKQMHDSKAESQCSLQSLQDQIQKAIQLEFYTIPLYLTSLYSIKDGCNEETYDLIASVVMQEMLHMAQSANILIATGGQPIIDAESIAPKYPATGLPGGVLPKLTVNLKKLSLDHVYSNFMAVETPEWTPVGGMDHLLLYTIGEFYEEIARCITILEKEGQDIFDPATADQQVQWPWDESNILGTLHIVTNTNTTLNAIDEIVSQGEGSAPLDPYDISNNSIAHFFKFEEIVCQRHMIKVNESFYAYAGELIPFDPFGVWPMRDNPGTKGIERHSNCYTESKAFHQAYRALLRKLQEAFSGSPECITDTVEIMETLQVHAKKLMWTRLDPSDPDNDTTCGPVWDYTWTE